LSFQGLKLQTASVNPIRGFNPRGSQPPAEQPAPGRRRAPGTLFNNLPRAPCRHWSAQVNSHIADVAQSGRARRFQRRGHEFESRHPLHVMWITSGVSAHNAGRNSGGMWRHPSSSRARGATAAIGPGAPGRTSRAGTADVNPDALLDHGSDRLPFTQRNRFRSARRAGQDVAQQWAEGRAQRAVPDGVPRRQHSGARSVLEQRLKNVCSTPSTAPTTHKALPLASRDGAARNRPYIWTQRRNASPATTMGK
jgi:hypothetical protein